MLSELRVGSYIEEGDEGQISERLCGCVNTTTTFNGSVTAM
jgi:hypothetical protein